MEILRIFPRKTNATPDDDMAVVGSPSHKFMDSISFSEAHVSVTFTWDIPKAEAIAEKIARWGYPVDIGGPAYGDRFGDFVPGMYIKEGYVFTSRGCTKDCWFCAVPAACHGVIKELPIYDGWNILDDNILATSTEHFDAVIEMLKRQPHKPRFTGGLEQSMLTAHHCEKLAEVTPESLYFAYDTLDDLEPLVVAGEMLRSAGVKTRSGRYGCYVLIGYDGDSFAHAERRCIQTIEAGFMPYAMLYRGIDGAVQEDWRPFQREWCSPYIVGAKMQAIKREAAT